MLGTNNDSFDDNDDGDDDVGTVVVVVVVVGGGGGGGSGGADVDDGVGDSDGDEHDSCIGKSRTCSDSHFVAYVRDSIMTILVWF